MFKKSKDEQDKKKRFFKKTNENENDNVPDKKIKSERRGKFIKSLIIPVIFSLILVVIIFLVIQAKTEHDDVKVKTVIAVKNIPAHTYVSKNNLDKHVKVISADADVVPDNSFKSLNPLLKKKGIFFSKGVSKSEIVKKSDISFSDMIMDKYKDGFQETSFSAENFANGVNGAIRKGDIVDVYAKSPDGDSLLKYAENVYVSAVYDQSGNKVDSPDSIATSFTVYVANDEIDSLNTAIANGGIQIYRTEY